MWRTASDTGAGHDGLQSDIDRNTGADVEAAVDWLHQEGLSKRRKSPTRVNCRASVFGIGCTAPQRRDHSKSMPRPVRYPATIISKPGENRCRNAAVSASGDVDGLERLTGQAPLTVDGRDVRSLLAAVGLNTTPLRHFPLSGGAAIVSAPYAIIPVSRRPQAGIGVMVALGSSG